jgi:hypothetical protein
MKFNAGLNPQLQSCRHWSCRDSFLTYALLVSGTHRPSDRRLFEQIVKPLGVAVLINGKHMCAMARGVRDTHSVMKVNVMHGAFQKDQTLRNEFLSRLSTA